MRNVIDTHLDTIVLRPHWKQFVVMQLPFIVFAAAAVGLALSGKFPYCWLLAFPALFLLTYLLCQGLYIARVRFIITDEQLIMQHGVLQRSTDYLELYRVVDYQQRCTLMQQIAGLKTVTVFSGDRNTPQLDIPGIRREYDIVGLIRERVEYNKARKGIHEITNR